MIEGRHGLLSLLDEVSSYKDNDGAVLVNRYNRAMAKHDHYFPGEEAVFGTAYGSEYPLSLKPALSFAISLCSVGVQSYEVSKEQITCGCDLLSLVYFYVGDSSGQTILGCTILPLKNKRIRFFPL